MAAAHGGGGGREKTRRAWGGSRNVKARPVGTEEACRWRNDGDHGAQRAAMVSIRERARHRARVRGASEREREQRAPFSFT